MRRKVLCLLGVLFVIHQLAIAQMVVPRLSGVTIDSIPFQLTDHNNISIQTILNNRDTLNLMFHTAANGVTLIEEATVKLNSIKWDQKESVESWGGASESRFSKTNTLQIGPFSWEDIPIWENKNSGQGTDGKFGPNLFEDKILELNFEKEMLIVHQELPEKVSNYQKLPLTYENGFMFIKGQSKVGGQAFPNRFLIHSGFGGTILYDDEFVKQSEIGQQIEITEEQELKDSYGNILKTKKGILPYLSIGEEVFNDIPVGFFEGSIGRQKMSVMGGNLLKRFHIILDANREYIYIKSNKLKNLPYKDV